MHAPMILARACRTRRAPRRSPITPPSRKQDTSAALLVFPRTAAPGIFTGTFLFQTSKPKIVGEEMARNRGNNVALESWPGLDGNVAHPQTDLPLDGRRMRMFANPNRSGNKLKRDLPPWLLGVWDGFVSVAQEWRLRWQIQNDLTVGRNSRCSNANHESPNPCGEPLRLPTP